MVNEELVLALLKMMAKHPDNFPRVLSAIIRRETLALSEFADEAVTLIKDETELRRSNYLHEHLNAVVGRIHALTDFLACFRDVPLGQDELGVTTCETLRLGLGDLASWLNKEADECRVARYYEDAADGTRAWHEVTQEEFEIAKAKALEAASLASDAIEDWDESLAISWEEPEPEPDNRLGPDVVLE